MDDGACKFSLMSLMTDKFDSIIRTYFTVNSDDLVFHLEEIDNTYFEYIVFCQGLCSLKIL